MLETQNKWIRPKHGLSKCISYSTTALLLKNIIKIIISYLYNNSNNLVKSHLIVFSFIQKLMVGCLKIIHH